MTALPYEPGMRIIYDPASKRVTVCFRGRSAQLDGMFMTGADAKQAGGAYCRSAGWRPESPRQFSKSLLSHRRNPAQPF
jgi:hypothetical protein